jgi:asparagine synthase (glutamine-hydrolysing)
MLCLSNTLETLQCVPDISSDLDEAFVGEFLLRGYCLDLTRTIYSQIRRLRAGHLLKYKNQTSEIHRFAALPVEEPYQFSRSEEYVEQCRQVLSEAVQDRLPHTATALYLSGGLDSGSVCAVASRIAEQRGHKSTLKASTVSWNPIFEDPEPTFAALTAKHIGVAHQIFEADDCLPFASNDNSHRPAPEPSVEAFSARAHRNYLEIAKHSPVILSGDGGDDVLTGQSWPYFANLWSSGKWPELARILGSFVWAHGTLPPLRAGLRAKLRGLLPSADPMNGYPNWLNPKFAKRNELHEKWRAQEPLPAPEHPIHPQAYSALHKGYWSSVLDSEDAGNTHVALETRAPLLDLRVLRFLLRIPPVPWGIDKQLTRQAMVGYLPESILKRPKTPLLKDPLETCLETGKWSPILPENPPTVIHEFVNWQQWIETLKYSKGYGYSPNFFPLAFAGWLKDVENAHWIK